MAAVALGAVVIEKHFTLSNSLPGPDHAYALEPGRAGGGDRKVREVERSLGTGIKDAQPEELELRHFARRSIFTTRGRAGGPADPACQERRPPLRQTPLWAASGPVPVACSAGARPVRSLGADGGGGRAGAARARRGSVRLRPLDFSHTDRIVSWRARPEVARQFFSERAPTREEHEAWLSALLLRSDRQEFIIDDEELGRSAPSVCPGSTSAPTRRSTA